MKRIPIEYVPLKIIHTYEVLSEYIDPLGKGFVKCLCNETGPQWKPKLIRNWLEYVAVFEYGLTQYRIYREGYLDKVMISGLDKDGNRVRVFVDKRAKT